MPSEAVVGVDSEHAAAEAAEAVVLAPNSNDLSKDWQNEKRMLSARHRGRPLLERVLCVSPDAGRDPRVCGVVIEEDVSDPV